MLPIDDRTIERMNPAQAGRPDVLGDRKSLTLYEGMQGMLENTFMNIKNRSIKITAELDVPARANGVILSQGGRFGGWSLYVKDGKPAYVYNFLGLSRYTVAAPAGVARRARDRRARLRRTTGAGPGKGGKATLLVNGKSGVCRRARREDAAEHLLGGRNRGCRHRQPDTSRAWNRHRCRHALHREHRRISRSR